MDDRPEQRISTGISIILPYWQRSLALQLSLYFYRETYQQSGLDLEFVIVDDGSPTEPASQIVVEHIAQYPWPIILVELPRKHVPLNPCVPINRAVQASTKKLVFLTSPECVHKTPILDKAGQELAASNNYKDVVVCAVRDDNENRWLAHSQHYPMHYHYANLMTRQFFDEVGGFDEQYRDGYCFDDPDFVETLDNYGAHWIERDDLIAYHEHVPAASKKDPNRKQKWLANAKIFAQKWGRLPKEGGY